jgi:hypothetical protein
VTPLAWLIGWPGIIVTFVLISAGLAKKRPHVMLAGVCMSLPLLLLYLLGSPLFQYWSLIIAALNFAAVYALYKGHRSLSVLLVTPYTLVVLWLIYVGYNAKSGP